MLRTLIAALISGSALTFLYWLDHPLMRYQGATDRSCSVRLLANLPEQLDVLFLGSSRVRRGIWPSTVSQQLKLPDGTVFASGLAGRDILRSWVILRDLVHRGIVPQFVVLEVNLELMRGVDTKFRAPPKKSTSTWMTFEDIYHHWQRFGSSDPSITQALYGKLSQGLILNLTGAFYYALKAIGAEPPLTCAKKKYTVEKKHRQKKLKIEQSLLTQSTYVSDEFDTRFLDNQFQKAEKIELFYLDKIRRLLESIGSTLILHRPYGYLDKPISPKVLQQLRNKLPELRAPSAKFVYANQHNFHDATHHNVEGRKRYSEWIARAISAEGNP